MKKEYITEVAWIKILNLLKNCKKVHVGNENSCRSFINTIYWMSGTGAPGLSEIAKSDDGHRLMADARNLHLPKTPNPFEIIRNCLNTFDALRRDLLWQKRPATTESKMEVI